MYTLKLASLSSGAFVTVLPEVGRFHRITFGTRGD
jgi:hypothetical protein